MIKLESIETWCKVIEEQGYIDVIYPDFAKPFDAVPHKRLFLYAFLSRYDNNPRRRFTIHTTLNTEQNQLAIKVSADN